MSDNSPKAGSNSRRKREQVPAESVDALSREYFSNPEVFADAFNYFLYDGKPVITPDSLTPMDPNEMLLPSHLGLVGKAFERRRDLVKQFACKRGKEASYAILAIEEQTKPDYGMPVRTMTYDALRYNSQVQTIRYSRPKKGEDVEAGKNIPFITDLLPGDKLKPVITLVVYLSDTAWSGARTLHDLLDIQDERLKCFISDYRLNLIEPYSMSPEELRKLSTDLRGILYGAKFAHDNARLLEGILSEECCGGLNPHSVPLFQKITNYNFSLEQLDTTTILEDNMKLKEYCIELGRQEGIEIGMKKGRLEGRQEGRLEGEKTGHELGEIDGIICVLKGMNMPNDMIFQKVIDVLGADGTLVKQRMALQGL
ncbi:MAG: Yae1 family protein [Victivallales bacterium]|nr:Yae1 family protein [Victivallales bacterium]